jgi:RNA 3'-terminal phosphate cyclase (ATP)
MVTLEHEHVTELATSFGEKALGAEQVASRLIGEVLAYQGRRGAAGEHLADQLALPLALAVVDTRRAARYSFTAMSEHTRTNFGVIERFLPVRCEAHEEPGRWVATIAPA